MVKPIEQNRRRSCIALPFERKAVFNVWRAGFHQYDPLAILQKEYFI
jgi:hypothetical protein